MSRRKTAARRDWAVVAAGCKVARGHAARCIEQVDLGNWGHRRGRLGKRELARSIRARLQPVPAVTEALGSI